MKIGSRVIQHFVAASLFVCLGFLDSREILSQTYDGSFLFSANQRFMKQSILRNVNGRSPWGAMHYAIDLGFFEWHGLEPRFGIGLMKDTSRALGTAGFDRFSYTLIDGRLGLHYKPYTYHTSIVAPYVDFNMIMTKALGRWRYASGDSSPKLSGYEIGLKVGGGLFLSFMFDAERRHDLQTEWEVKDFGLTAGLEYMKGGLGTSGSFYDLVGETSMWSFGLGLLIDW